MGRSCIYFAVLLLLAALCPGIASDWEEDGGEAGYEAPDPPASGGAEFSPPRQQSPYLDRSELEEYLEKVRATARSRNARQRAPGRASPRPMYTPPEPTAAGEPPPPGTAPATSETVDEAEAKVNVLLVLDRSAQMSQRVSSGIGSRLDAAKSTVAALLDLMPKSANIGLATFGGKSATPLRSDCEAFDLLVPFGRNNRKEIMDRVDQVQASGPSNLSLALSECARTMQGKRAANFAVVLTAGEDTCGQSPCELARNLARSGESIRFEIVAFTSAPATSAPNELECIASSSGGAVYDASHLGTLAGKLALLADPTGDSKDMARWNPKKTTAWDSDVPVPSVPSTGSAGKQSAHKGKSTTGKTGARFRPGSWLVGHAHGAFAVSGKATWQGVRSAGADAVDAFGNTLKSMIPPVNYGYGLQPYVATNLPPTYFQPYQPGYMPRYPYIPPGVPIYRAPARMPIPNYSIRPGRPQYPVARRSNPAIARLNQVVALSNQAISLIEKKGSPGQKSEDLARARELLLGAMSLDPNPASANVHFNLAHVDQKEGQFLDAIEGYKRALNFNPDMAAATLNIASCYQQMGEIAPAISWLEKYIRENPRGDQRLAAQRMLTNLRDADSSWTTGDPHAPDYFECVAARGAGKWPADSFPLKVCIEDGRGVGAMRDSYRMVMETAFEKWCKAADRRVSWTRVDSAGEADIVCKWDSLGAGEDRREGGITKSEMSIKRDGSVVLGAATITIWTLYPNGEPIDSDAVIESVCLHEIGHALGLTHSPNNSDIMFFTAAPEAKTELSQRDVATVKKLYESYRRRVSFGGSIIGRSVILNFHTDTGALPRGPKSRGTAVAEFGTCWVNGARFAVSRPCSLYSARNIMAVTVAREWTRIGLVCVVKERKRCGYALSLCWQACLSFSLCVRVRRRTSLIQGDFIATYRST